MNVREELIGHGRRRLESIGAYLVPIIASGGDESIIHIGINLAAIQLLANVPYNHSDSIHREKNKAPQLSEHNGSAYPGE